MLQEYDTLEDTLAQADKDGMAPEQKLELIDFWRNGAMTGAAIDFQEDWKTHQEFASHVDDEVRKHAEPIATSLTSKIVLDAFKDNPNDIPRFQEELEKNQNEFLKYSPEFLPVAKRVFQQANDANIPHIGGRISGSMQDEKGNKIVDYSVFGNEGGKPTYAKVLFNEETSQPLQLEEEGGLSVKGVADSALGLTPKQTRTSGGDVIKFPKNFSGLDYKIQSLKDKIEFEQDKLESFTGSDDESENEINAPIIDGIFKKIQSYQDELSSIENAAPAMKRKMEEDGVNEYVSNVIKAKIAAEDPKYKDVGQGRLEGFTASATKVLRDSYITGVQGVYGMHGLLRDALSPNRSERVDNSDLDAKVAEVQEAKQVYSSKQEFSRDAIVDPEVAKSLSAISGTITQGVAIASQFAALGPKAGNIAFFLQANGGTLGELESKSMTLRKQGDKLSADWIDKNKYNIAAQASAIEVGIEQLFMGHNPLRAVQQGGLKELWNIPGEGVEEGLAGAVNALARYTQGIDTEEEFMSNVEGLPSDVLLGSIGSVIPVGARSTVLGIMQSVIKNKSKPTEPEQSRTPAPVTIPPLTDPKLQESVTETSATNQQERVNAAENLVKAMDGAPGDHGPRPRVNPKLKNYLDFISTLAESEIKGLGGTKDASLVIGHNPQQTEPDQDQSIFQVYEGTKPEFEEAKLYDAVTKDALLNDPEFVALDLEEKKSVVKRMVLNTNPAFKAVKNNSVGVADLSGRVYMVTAGQLLKMLENGLDPNAHFFYQRNDADMHQEMASVLALVPEDRWLGDGVGSGGKVNTKGVAIESKGNQQAILKPTNLGIETSTIGGKLVGGSNQLINLDDELSDPEVTAETKTVSVDDFDRSNSVVKQKSMTGRFLTESGKVKLVENLNAKYGKNNWVLKTDSGFKGIGLVRPWMDGELTPDGKSLTREIPVMPDHFYIAQKRIKPKKQYRVSVRVNNDGTIGMIPFGVIEYVPINKEEAAKEDGARGFERVPKLVVNKSLRDKIANMIKELDGTEFNQGTDTQFGLDVVEDSDGKFKILEMNPTDEVGEPGQINMFGSTLGGLFSMVKGNYSPESAAVFAAYLRVQASEAAAANNIKLADELSGRSSQLLKKASTGQAITKEDIPEAEKLYQERVFFSPRNGSRVIAQAEKSTLDDIGLTDIANTTKTVEDVLSGIVNSRHPIKQWHKKLAADILRFAKAGGSKGLTDRVVRIPELQLIGGGVFHARERVVGVGNSMTVTLHEIIHALTLHFIPEEIDTYGKNILGKDYFRNLEKALKRKDYSPQLKNLIRDYIAAVKGLNLESKVFGNEPIKTGSDYGERTTDKIPYALSSLSEFVADSLLSDRFVNQISRIHGPASRFYFRKLLNSVMEWVKSVLFGKGSSGKNLFDRLYNDVMMLIALDDSARSDWESNAASLYNFNTYDVFSVTERPYIKVGEQPAKDGEPAYEFFQVKIPNSPFDGKVVKMPANASRYEIIRKIDSFRYTPKFPLQGRPYDKGGVQDMQDGTMVQQYHINLPHTDPHGSTINVRVGATHDEIMRAIEAKYGANVRYSALEAGGGFVFGLPAVEKTKNGWKMGGKPLEKGDKGIASVPGFKSMTGLRDAEIELYKYLVPQAFTNEGINVPMLVEGLKKAEKLIQVDVYGQSKDRLDDPTIDRFQQLTHDWHDNLGSVMKNYVDNYIEEEYEITQNPPNIERMRVNSKKHLKSIKALVDSDYHPEEQEHFLEILEEYKGLYIYANNADYNDSSITATSAYNTVSPFPVDQYPVVRVDVSMPVKFPTINAENREEFIATYGRMPTSEEMGLLWQQDDMHENLPNTLGWAMVQVVPDPKTGEQVMFVAELQSRWAQIVRDNQSPRDITPNEQQYDDIYGRKFTNHPLLEIHQALVLKSVIAEAEKRGINKIAISDAETAMMTEGHDAAAKQVYVADLDEIKKRFLLPKDVAEKYELVTPEFHPTPKTVAELVNKETGEIVARIAALRDVKQGFQMYPTVDTFDTSFAKYVMVLDSAKLIISEPSQSKGMRLAYDQTLPSIMKKLTGQQGSMEDFGGHKNQKRTLEGYENKGSPVFKTKEGIPKTQATARVYDISNFNRGKVSSLTYYSAKGDDFVEINGKLINKKYLTPKQINDLDNLSVDLKSGLLIPSEMVEEKARQFKQVEEDARFQLLKNEWPDAFKDYSYTTFEGARSHLIDWLLEHPSEIKDGNINSPPKDKTAENRKNLVEEFGDALLQMGDVIESGLTGFDGMSDTTKKLIADVIEFITVTQDPEGLTNRQLRAWTMAVNQFIESNGTNIRGFSMIVEQIYNNREGDILQDERDRLTLQGIQHPWGDEIDDWRRNATPFSKTGASLADFWTEMLAIFNRPSTKKIFTDLLTPFKNGINKYKALYSEFRDLYDDRIEALGETTQLNDVRIGMAGAMTQFNTDIDGMPQLQSIVSQIDESIRRKSRYGQSSKFRRMHSFNREAQLERTAFDALVGPIRGLIDTNAITVDDAIDFIEAQLTEKEFQLLEISREPGQRFYTQLDGINQIARHEPLQNWKNYTKRVQYQLNGEKIANTWGEKALQTADSILQPREGLGANSVFMFNYKQNMDWQLQETAYELNTGIERVQLFNFIKSDRFNQLMDGADTKLGRSSRMRSQIGGVHSNIKNREIQFGAIMGSILSVLQFMNAKKLISLKAFANQLIPSFMVTMTHKKLSSEIAWLNTTNPTYRENGKQFLKRLNPDLANRLKRWDYMIESIKGKSRYKSLGMPGMSALETLWDSLRVTGSRVGHVTKKIASGPFGVNIGITLTNGVSEVISAKHVFFTLYIDALIKDGQVASAEDFFSQAYPIMDEKLVTQAEAEFDSYVLTPIQPEFRSEFAQRNSVGKIVGNVLFFGLLRTATQNAMKSITALRDMNFALMEYQATGSRDSREFYEYASREATKQMANIVIYGAITKLFAHGISSLFTSTMYAVAANMAGPPEDKDYWLRRLAAQEKINREMQANFTNANMLADFTYFGVPLPGVFQANPFRDVASALIDYMRMDDKADSDRKQEIEHYTIEIDNINKALKAMEKTGVGTETDYQKLSSSLEILEYSKQLEQTYQARKDDWLQKSYDRAKDVAPFDAFFKVKEQTEDYTPDWLADVFYSPDENTVRSRKELDQARTNAGWWALSSFLSLSTPAQGAARDVTNEMVRQKTEKEDSSEKQIQQSLETYGLPDTRK